MPARIRDTDRSRNLEIHAGTRCSPDDMEALLREVAEQMGLFISHVTVLGTRKYPGNRHWHFKRGPKEKGCLDVTYWPDGDLMWVSMRNYEPPWVHDAGPTMKRLVEQARDRSET